MTFKGIRFEQTCIFAGIQHLLKVLLVTMPIEVKSPLNEKKPITQHVHLLSL
jgi:hypothetical protein